MVLYKTNGQSDCKYVEFAFLVGLFFEELHVSLQALLNSTVTQGGDTDVSTFSNYRLRTLTATTWIQSQSTSTLFFFSPFFWLKKQLEMIFKWKKQTPSNKSNVFFSVKEIKLKTYQKTSVSRNEIPTSDAPTTTILLLMDVLDSVINFRFMWFKE